MSSEESQFGGPWTEKKLEILKGYLKTYTTILKKTNLELLYIDAFAGTGRVEIRRDGEDFEDRKRFIDGSTRIAIEVKDRIFDELIFIEKDLESYNKLKELKEEFPNRNIEMINGDSNEYIIKMRGNWKRKRGVLFLDPFGAQVNWTTLEAVASYKAIDVWILFPTSAIARMLPKSRMPEDISDGLAKSLTRVYGRDSWRSLYHTQGNLFHEDEKFRDTGVYGLREIYKNQLRDLFGERFLDRSKTLKGPTNSPLYEFMFCTGSDSRRAIEISKGVATHLIDNL